MKYKSQSKILCRNSPNVSSSSIAKVLPDVPKYYSCSKNQQNQSFNLLDQFSFWHALPMTHEYLKTINCLFLILKGKKINVEKPYSELQFLRKILLSCQRVKIKDILSSLTSPMIVYFCNLWPGQKLNMHKETDCKIISALLHYDSNQVAIKELILLILKPIKRSTIFGEIIWSLIYLIK